jgi:hypothetical protein
MEKEIIYFFNFKNPSILHLLEIIKTQIGEIAEFKYEIKALKIKYCIKLC